MEGVCSECGFHFDWADVCLKERQELPWLYEHCRGVSCRSMIATAAMILRPWSFWKHVQPHHRVSMLRLFMFPILYALCLYAASTLLGLLVFGIRYALFGQSAMITHSGSWQISLGYLATSQFGVAYSAGYGWDWSGYSTDTQITGVLVWFVSFGILLSALISRSSFKGSPVRGVHLLRVTFYSFIPAMSAAVLLMVLWLSDRIVRDDFGGTMYFYYSSTATLSAWDQLRTTMRDWIESPVVSLLAPVCFLYLWWFFALRTGLRLRDWWQIMLAGLILGPLVALAIGFVISAVFEQFA